MEKKRGFFGRMGDFLTGKGFYIVLLLCAVVIGVTAWVYVTVISDRGGDTGGIDTSVSGLTDETDGASSYVAADDGADTEDAVDASLVQGAEADDNTQADASLEGTEDDAAAASTEEMDVYDICFTWPLDGEITTTYAMDTLIYDKTMCDWRTHDGLDMACSQGTKVMAVADGTVEDVYDDYMLGTTVVIDHGAGVKTYYSNLQAVPTVAPGDWVWAGYVIGSVGDTAIGESGIVSHLHIAMTIDGESVDPEDYFPE